MNKHAMRYDNDVARQEAIRKSKRETAKRRRDRIKLERKLKLKIKPTDTKRYAIRYNNDVARQEAKRKSNRESSQRKRDRDRNVKFDEQQYRELVMGKACPICNCTIGTNFKNCWVCRALMCRTSCRSSPRKHQEQLKVLNEKTVVIGGYSFTSGLIDLPVCFQQNNFDEKWGEMFDKGYQPPYIPPARLRGGARNKKKNSKRKKQMSITGSTVMAATGEFLFEHTEDSGVKTSPRARLNSKCKPGGRGAQNLMDENIRPLALALEALVYKHNPECRVDLNLAKKIIPDHLRLFGTCFTAFAMVGDTSDGYVHIHKDKDDVASIILSMGADDVKGGDTVYYEDEKGRTEIGRTKFQHGQFQTGAFHNVYHGGERWTGKRGMISFYLNKRMLTHAIKYRDTEWHKEAYIKYTI